MKINIEEGNIVRHDDDSETPWFVVHIDEDDKPKNLLTPDSRLVWIRKMGRHGKAFINLPKWEAQDVITTMNRLWIA